MQFRKKNEKYHSYTASNYIQLHPASHRYTLKKVHRGAPFNLVELELSFGFLRSCVLHNSLLLLLDTSALTATATEIIQLGAVHAANLV